MPENKKISAVIAAYNEERRIAEVLSVVKRHPLVGEIIVIDDGSVDKTSEVIKEFKVTLIRNKKNMGKTISIKHGLEKSRGEFILFLDADLIGLTKENIDNLVNPVLNGQVDWTLSMRGNSALHMKLLNIDCLSGERVIKRYLLDDPQIWSKPGIGFGLEILMNKSLIDRKTTFMSINLPNLKVITKSGKVGFLRGWYGELKMIKQIIKVIPIHKVIHQFFLMSYLNKKIKKSFLNLEANEV
ncbi:MAG: glycosyltransferase family 2 protein [Actinobacteria bacterium]|nr:glycosyltransferase family 2 protein [Actinomycetota bacterium]